MDEITLFTTIQPPPPDDPEAIRRAARARLAAAMSSQQPPARHLRRRLVLAAVACGTAAVIAAAVSALVGGAGRNPARTGPGAAHVRMAAYVLSRVEAALASKKLVFRGRTTGTNPPTISWAYGPRNRFEEFTGSGEPFLAQGTALIGGKLTGVLVTYYNRKWSLLPDSIPASACSRTGTAEMAGPPVPARDWPAFIHATLACGAATVTGHSWIGGVNTVRITGVPVTEKLKANYAKVIHEKWLRSQWTLYVDPKTFLPVRLSGSSYSYGGPMPSYYSTGVTDMQWLRPTAANIAKALVTIPRGFRQVRSLANQ
jgi:hypothetical protein